MAPPVPGRSAGEIRIRRGRVVCGTERQTVAGGAECGRDACGRVRRTSVRADEKERLRGEANAYGRFAPNAPKTAGTAPGSRAAFVSALR